MIDETTKLEEFDNISKVYLDWMTYFLKKVVSKDISQNDKEKFIEICGKHSITVSQLFKDINVKNEDVVEGLRVGLAINDDNIKNS